MEHFLKWVEFRGELYGTQKKTLLDALDLGVTVIWKIETKGVKNIQEKDPSHGATCRLRFLNRRIHRRNERACNES